MKKKYQMRLFLLSRRRRRRERIGIYKIKMLIRENNVIYSCRVSCVSSYIKHICCSIRKQISRNAPLFTLRRTEIFRHFHTRFIACSPEKRNLAKRRPSNDAVNFAFAIADRINTSSDLSRSSCRDDINPL